MFPAMNTLHEKPPTLAGLCLVALLLAPPAQRAAAEEDEAIGAAGKFLEKLLADESGEIAGLAEAVLGKNGGDKLFYFPMRDLRWTPEDYELEYEDVRFGSGDGTELHGWFIPAAGGAGEAEATVVFSHGNAGNVSYHLEFVAWLPPRGYNVLLWDYRGFGRSAGEVSRRGLVEDVSAAFEYVRSRDDIDRSRLVSFSHSIGGTKALAALGARPVEGLRAVITDAAFSSYRNIARRKAGAVGAKLVSDELSPIGHVDKIAPVPLLLVHGTGDAIIPIAEGEALFAKAGEPKTFLRVEGGRHDDSLSRNGGEYRDKVLEWLEGVLSAPEGLDSPPPAGR